MIKINNILYSDSTIRLQFGQLQELLLESTNSIVVWEIVKFPNSPNNPNFESSFSISGSKKSTNNPERLQLDISGHYYIKIVERDLNGNYRKIELYLKILDLVMKSSIPMIGETFEFDEIGGWGKTIENSIQQLNQKNLATVVKGISESELMVGELVYIQSIYEQNTPGFTFHIDSILNYHDGTNVQLGIVVEKIDLNLTEDHYNVYGEENYVYIILMKGILNVSEQFSLDVDDHQRFFYNVDDTILTNNPQDSYVGKFFNEEKMIMMESEIYLMGTYQNIFSLNNS